MDQRASGTASSMVGVPFTGTLGGWLWDDPGFLQPPILLNEFLYAFAAAYMEPDGAMIGGKDEFKGEEGAAVALECDVVDERSGPCGIAGEAKGVAIGQFLRLLRVLEDVFQFITTFGLLLL